MSASTTTTTVTTRNVSTYDQVDDLTRLATLDENTFLQVIRHRFLLDKVYTNVGDILLAVNPYRNIPGLYDYKPIAEEQKPTLAKQISTASGKLPVRTPHIYGTASKMYRQLLHTGKSQCCVITGESGAGKTESTKYIVDQIIQLSCGGLGDKLQQQIMAVNPVLEAFGNAQTRLNHNSSRFGKLIALHVSPVTRRVCGARISEYLFEKSRVIQQYEGETNFHIFSYVVHGLDDNEKSKYGLLEGDIRSSDYTRCFFSNNHIAAASGPRFRHEQTSKMSLLRKALESTGFCSSDIDNVFSVVCGITKLGNVRFIKSALSESQVSVVDDSMTNLREVCSIFHINPDEFYQLLTYLELHSRGEMVKRRYNYSEAIDCRDSAAKAVYHRLFSWIVARMNRQFETSAEENCDGGVDVRNNNLTIDVLDIFGFENLPHNSFEQLCINMANEQVQSVFCQQVFQRELLEHEIEGIRIAPLTDNNNNSFHIDNSDIVEMFFGRPLGMLSLLDEESHFPSGSDESMVAKFTHHFRNHPKFTKLYRLSHGDSSPLTVSHRRTKTSGDQQQQHHIRNASSFIVKHYAGPVEYQSNGFLKKNRDSLPDKFVQVFQRSESLLLRAMFAPLGQLDCNISQENAKPPCTWKNDSTIAASSYGGSSGNCSFKKRRALLPLPQFNGVVTPERPPSGTPTSSSSSNRKKMTVGNQFKLSLSLLMSRISTNELHFVRCIKPNKLQKPHEFDDAYVEQQLRYTGVLETVRIRREGYSHRPTFADFIQTYHGLSNTTLFFAGTAIQNSSSGTLLKASERVACIRILQQAAAAAAAAAQAGSDNKKNSQGGWCLGRTKVFMRYWLADKLNAQLQRRHCAAVVIQRHIRGFLARKTTRQRRRFVCGEAAQQKKEEQTVMCRPNACFSMSNDVSGSSVAADDDDESCQHQQQKHQKREQKTYFGFAHHQSSEQRQQQQEALPSIVINGNNTSSSLHAASFSGLSCAEAPRDLTPSIIYNDPAQQQHKCSATVNFSRSDFFDAAAAADEEDATPTDARTEEMLVTMTSEGSSINSSLFSYTKMHSDGRQSCSENYNNDALSNAHEVYSNDMQYPWFHGYMSRRQAERTLRRTIVGCFLIRVSESHSGYSLSFKAADRIRHYMIDRLPHGGGFHIPGECHVHASLLDLVEHYKCHGMSNYAGHLTIPYCTAAAAADVTSQAGRTLSRQAKKVTIASHGHATSEACSKRGDDNDEAAFANNNSRSTAITADIVKSHVIKNNNNNMPPLPAPPTSSSSAIIALSTAKSDCIASAPEIDDEEEEDEQKSQKQMGKVAKNSVANYPQTSRGNTSEQIQTEFLTKAARVPSKQRKQQQQQESSVHNELRGVELPHTTTTTACDKLQHWPSSSRPPPPIPQRQQQQQQQQCLAALRLSCTQNDDDDDLSHNNQHSGRTAGHHAAAISRVNHNNNNSSNNKSSSCRKNTTTNNSGNNGNCCRLQASAAFRHTNASPVSSSATRPSVLLRSSSPQDEYVYGDNTC